MNGCRDGTAWGFTPFGFRVPTCKPTPYLLSFEPPLKPAHAQNWTGCKRKKVNNESFHIGLLKQTGRFCGFCPQTLCELTKRGQRRHVVWFVGCLGPDARTCSSVGCAWSGRRMIGGGKRCRRGRSAGWRALSTNCQPTVNKLSTL